MLFNGGESRAIITCLDLDTGFKVSSIIFENNSKLFVLSPAVQIEARPKTFPSTENGCNSL